MKLLHDQELLLVAQSDLVGEGANMLLESIGKQDMSSVSAVTLSLSGADKIDLAGVAVLVRLHSWASQAGVPLYLMDVSQAIAQELERIGLNDVFYTTEPPDATDRGRVFELPDAVSPSYATVRDGTA